MSIAGTNLAQSVAGAPLAERAEGRARKVEAERPGRARRTRDGFDTFVANTEGAGAVRRLASNDQEDAHEDRQGQARYAPPATTPAKDGRKHIDVEG